MGIPPTSRPGIARFMTGIPFPASPRPWSEHYWALWESFGLIGAWAIPIEGFTINFVGPCCVLYISPTRRLVTPSGFELSQRQRGCIRRQSSLGVDDQLQSVHLLISSLWLLV